MDHRQRGNEDNLPAINDMFNSEAIPPSDYNVIVAENEAKRPKLDICTIFKFFILGVISFAFLFFSIDSFTSNYTRTLVDDFMIKISSYNGFLVFFCYYLMNTFALIIAFPCTLLNLYGGLLFGLKYGFSLGVFISVVVIQLSVMTAEFIIFRVAKFGFGDQLQMIEHRYKLLWAIRLALRKRGFKINTLLRLSPIVPSAILNYALPLLGSKLIDIELGLLFGNLPWAVASSVIGALLDDTSSIISFLDDMPNWLVLVIGLFGFLFLVLGIWAIYAYTNEALQDIINEDIEENNACRSGSRSGSASDGGNGVVGTETESLLHRRQALRRDSKDNAEDMELIC